MNTNVDIIRNAYVAFAQEDIPAVLAVLDDDIEWYVPDELPEGGGFRGHDAVLGFFGGLAELYDELRVEPDRFHGAGDRVIAEGHHRGRIGDTAFEVGFAHMWTMRDGRAVAYREYTDSGKLLALFRAAPAPTRRHGTR